MAQLKRKFLLDNAVNGAKLRLDNNDLLRARNAADSADVGILKLTTANAIEFQSLPTVLGGDTLATQAFVQSAQQGLKPKAAVRAGTTANITLTAPQTVDGVVLIAGDRVLVKNQTLPAQNGLYVVNAGVWTRSVDADTSVELEQSYTFIQEGTQAGQGWVQSGTIATLGTSPVTFVFFNSAVSYSAGPGIDVTGTVISAKVDGVTVKTNASSQLESLKPTSEKITLNGTDITNQYVDLAHLVTSDASVSLVVIGGIEQEQGVDYTLSTQGGVTRVTFAGGLASAGESALISGEILVVKYAYL